LSERPETTAVFTRNDVIAAGVLQALREAGIAVPDRISVLSYYDTLLARCASPPLTSVHTPIEEAGRLAVGRLIDAIEGRVSSFEGIQLPTSLIIRDSTAPAPGEGKSQRAKGKRQKGGPGDRPPPLSAARPRRG